ncbi:MAG: hypothetical protein Q4F57_09505 [Weeksellaceae bacterium]|nr:hypothetical protein [Weeksellaceae bacterium]
MSQEGDIYEAPVMVTYDTLAQPDTLNISGLDDTTEIDVSKLKTHQEEGAYFQRSLVDNNEYYFNGALKGAQAHRYAVRIEQAKNFRVEVLAEPSSIEMLLKQDGNTVMQRKSGENARQELAAGIYELEVRNPQADSGERIGEYSISIY